MEDKKTENTAMNPEEAPAKKRKGMTLPNKLTMLRILAIPVMIIIYYIPALRNNNLIEYTSGGRTYAMSWMYFIEFIIFALASITDFLDGKIARKYNLVTTFGKFADPLADKMLVFTAMTLFMIDNPGVPAKFEGYHFVMLVPYWAFAIILIRELAVSGIRMVSSGRGKTIAAGWSGKVKTFVTMIALIICFFAGLHEAVFWIGHALMVVSVVLTVYSGVVYFNGSKDIILESI